MRAKDFNVQKLIDSLDGSCQSIQEALNTLYDDMDEADLTKKDHETIDDQIFRCDTCDWWFEVGEQDKESNCSNCTQEDDEDYEE